MIYMVSYIQINGRLTQEPVVKAVKTRKGEIEVVEIAIITILLAKIILPFTM